MVATRSKRHFAGVLTEDHLIAPFEDNRPNTLWVAGVDPGWDSPCALVIAKGDATGRLHVLYAHQFSHCTFREVAGIIDNETGGECVMLGVDPAMRAHCQQTGITGLDWWRKQGFQPRCHPATVKNRLAHARKWLSQPPLFGGITISHEAGSLWEALHDYAVSLPEGALATCLTPTKSHLVDAFCYMLATHHQMIAENAYGDSRLPQGHKGA